MCSLQNYLDNSLYPIRPLYFGAATAAAAAVYSTHNLGLINILPLFGESDIAKVEFTLFSQMNQQLAVLPYRDRIANNSLPSRIRNPLCSTTLLLQIQAMAL